MMEEYARIMSDAQSDRITIATADRAQATVFCSFMVFQVVIMLSAISAITVKRACWPLGLGISAIGSIFFIDGFYLFY